MQLKIIEKCEQEGGCDYLEPLSIRHAVVNKHL